MPRNVVIRGVHGTRLAKGRRVVVDGVVNDELLFPKKLVYEKPEAQVIRELVKGIFYQSPELISANAEQIAIETAVQQIGIRRLCTIGGCTKAGLTKMLLEVIQSLSLYATSLAISQGRQHDRDLAEAKKTEEPIARWRRDHPPTGNPDLRDATMAQSNWVNRITNALSQIAKANELKKNHPSALSKSPVVKLCYEKKGICQEVDKQMVDSLYNVK